jgi:hypothetical protein
MDFAHGFFDGCQEELCGYLTCRHLSTSICFYCFVATSCEMIQLHIYSYIVIAARDIISD